MMNATMWYLAVGLGVFFMADMIVICTEQYM